MLFLSGGLVVVVVQWVRFDQARKNRANRRRPDWLASVRGRGGAQPTWSRESAPGARAYRVSPSPIERAVHAKSWAFYFRNRAGLPHDLRCSSCFYRLRGWGRRH